MNELFSKAAETLFAQHPDIMSFGWYQWHTGEMLRNRDEVYTTIDKPDINGNLGEYLWDEENVERQKVVTEFLKQFDPSLMRIAFGDNAGIFMYRDLSIETIKHEPYDQAMPYEL